MIRKFAPLTLVFSVALIGALSQESASQEQTTGKQVPVITKGFASSKMNPGEIWKVYLNASHPAGEMKSIFAEVLQPGVDNQPISITRIKKENQKDFSGYIYLNTVGFAGASNLLNYTKFTLKVSIQDRQGQFSEPAFFVLYFDRRAVQETPPQGVFREEDLGPIMIKLSTVGGGGAGSAVAP